MDWYPQAPLTAFQAFRSCSFCGEPTCVVYKLPFWLAFVMLSFFTHFEKHEIDAERNSIRQVVEFRPEPSRLEPIGDRNDV